LARDHGPGEQLQLAVAVMSVVIGALFLRDDKDRDIND
jgi:hypothetical protein